MLPECVWPPCSVVRDANACDIDLGRAAKDLGVAPASLDGSSIPDSSITEVLQTADFAKFDSLVGPTLSFLPGVPVDLFPDCSHV